MTAAITRDNLGAWLIKCSPAVFDVPSLLEAGELVGGWSVTPGYRAQMMEIGDPALFWLSGAGRGILGFGRVTAPVYEHHGGGGHWLDKDKMRKAHFFVEFEIPFLESIITSERLQRSGIADLEVQRTPNGSNPSWVSREQLAQILPLLPAGALADEDVYDPTHEIGDPAAALAWGAGFGTPEHNKMVEEAATRAVIDYYRGWDYDDVSAAKVGWDAEFVHPRSGEATRVEIKGVSGSHPSVFLTANEIKAAKKHRNWYLAVVTEALTNPRVTEYESHEAVQVAQPVLYQADLSKLKD